MALGATVQLLNTIPDVVLTGNMVPLKFQASENMIETEGSLAEVKLLWTAAAVANEYFDLKLAGETVRFTCKESPDNSGIQFHDNSLAETLANWVALVATDLQKNYLISRYYDLTVSDTEITIIAKESGDEYSMELALGSGIDITPTVTNRIGIDEKLQAFYAIAILLYVNGSFATEMLLTPDAEGLAETDISKILAAYLSSDFQWPESDADFIYARTGNIKTWYFRYGEKYGDGLQATGYKALQTSSIYYALLGGISWMQYGKYNADGSSFWEKLQNNMYFLSWAPLTRYIGPAEPVKLYYLNHAAATTLKLKAKLYTASSNSTITVDSVAGVSDKSVYEFVLSPAKVNYAGLSNETLIKIEVWIDNESDVRISEIRTFIPDYTHYEHTRYFIFKNSLGTFEIIRTTGLMSKNDDYEREIAQVAADSDYTSKDREDVSVANYEKQRFSVAAGWLNRYADGEEFRNWLRDFALSREVYQAIGNTLKPIRLTGSSFEKGSDRDNIKQFSFEFVNAFTDEHFTKEITWNLFDESFNSDFEKAQ